MPNIRKAQMRARALRAKHEVTELPIDVLSLARLEDVEVDHSDLGDEISGVLLKDGERAVIGVNGRDPSTRQRFTVAHELATISSQRSRSLRR
jgi:Zn-dependent peptidase ImmA (M78 family)